MGRRTGPASPGHAHASVGMPPGAPKGCPIIVIPSPPQADRGTHSSASRSDTASLIASGGPCRAGHGVCHRGHRGHRGKPGDSTGLCGLCDSLWLVLSLRAVHPVRGRVSGGPIIVIPSDAVQSRAKHRGPRNPFSASRSDTTSHSVGWAVPRGPWGLPQRAPRAQRQAG